MAQSAEAYVDTSAFIAYADRSDTWHPLLALRKADKLACGPFAIQKTNSVRFLK